MPPVRSGPGGNLVLFQARRPYGSVLVARFFDPVDHDLKSLDACILLVDRLQDVPRCELRRSLLYHLVYRGFILVPLLSVTPVLIGCWWECKLVQPLWSTVWEFLKNWK